MYQKKVKTNKFCVVNTLEDIEALKKALNYKPKFKLSSIIFQSNKKINLKKR